MSDWKVGEKHGIYEVVELTPSVAKFRLPDGSIIETPNIYQKKEGGGNVSTAINDKPSVRKASKPKKDSEEDLQAQLEAARARLARAAKLKAMAG